jgi:hypothetical protein
MPTHCSTPVLPKPLTKPAPSLCSTKYLSADSLMQLDSPVVCQVPSRARPSMQTSWQEQPRQKVHNECASGYPADHGSFPYQGPGQQVPIESTEEYAEAPDTLNRMVQGWWPLTGSTLRAAFEVSSHVMGDRKHPDQVFLNWCRGLLCMRCRPYSKKESFPGCLALYPSVRRS